MGDEETKLCRHCHGYNDKDKPRIVSVDPDLCNFCSAEYAFSRMVKLADDGLFARELFMSQLLEFRKKHADILMDGEARDETIRKFRDKPLEIIHLELSALRKIARSVTKKKRR